MLVVGLELLQICVRVGMSFAIREARKIVMKMGLQAINNIPLQVKIIPLQVFCNLYAQVSHLAAK
jgi:hypothetical protein